jgi:hypothetical protein
MFEVGDRVIVINSKLKCFDDTGTVKRAPQLPDRHYRVILDNPEAYYHFSGWAVDMIKKEGMPLGESEIALLTKREPDWII